MAPESTREMVGARHAAPVDERVEASRDDGVEILRPMSEREPVPQTGFDPTVLLGKVLRHALAVAASDVHLRVRSHPIVRIDGVLHRLEQLPVLDVPEIAAIARRIMSERQWDQFRNRLQVDLSFGVRNVGRIRANIYQQRGSIAMALRVIKTDIPRLADLSLPEVIGRFAHYERGLVIFTGATGCGKSTTLAALVEEINSTRSSHVITIEDPVEYLFTERRAIISQREVGTDTTGFPEAMRAALREDPDVILLGEMRDRETIDAALTAAETGHLVLSTLHAPTASETITRMISAFPSEAQPTLRAKLSQNLRAVVAQRLLPCARGEGRVPACEIMTVSARVRELMLDPLKSGEIADLIKRGQIVEGMLSFDQHLYLRCKAGEITADIALQHASSATDLKLKLDGFAG